MTTTPNEKELLARLVFRKMYLQVIKAALRVKQFRFGREAALSWLSTFPGDLEVGLSYAQALVGEARPAQAQQVLQGLCRSDPEYVEAVESLLFVEEGIFQDVLLRSALSDPATQLAAGVSKIQELKNRQESNTASQLFALTGRIPGRSVLAEWGNLVRLARQALAQGDLVKAEESIRGALNADPSQPLTGVTHLELLAADRLAPLQVRLRLAETYHQRWPDCLVCSLFLADWLMESGQSGRAVAILHQAAARDVSGQVARRIWGEKHPYLPLWPERLGLPLKIPIPVEVLAFLGWNRLPAPAGLDQGTLETHNQDIRFPEAASESPIVTSASAVSVENKVEAPRDTPVELTSESEVSPCDQAHAILTSSDHGGPSLARSRTGVGEGALPIESGLADELQAPGKMDSDLPETIRETLLEEVDEQTEPPAEIEVMRAWHEEEKGHAEILHSVQQELERLANRLHLTGLSRLDGRFPIYVVFSVHSRLEAVYGPQLAGILEAEMGHLVELVQSERGWGARLFFADDPGSLSELGLKPARPGDAWDLKLALADLDAALARRGEMIGALLIVGGPEIVPFHHLPNPVDDQDLDVPSDNPYATRDENYFIPEWPVGRLPSGAGKDARLLLSSLRRISAHHAERLRRLPWYRRWLDVLASWFRPGRHRRRLSFGYTAAIWRRAASSVFRPIGEPEALHISPPLGLDNQNGSGNGRASNRARQGVPSPVGRLGYFNLHGLVDASDWYGQRDPLEPEGEPDYPVALRPQDIGGNGKPRSNNLPQIVFSEACYGLHILGRSVDQAMALKFLESGSLAVAGSTCMAYGSVGTPLIAADLLGHAFWRNIKDHVPAGEALRQAKISLVNEMNTRQGYLDGEDQKTLISFILYGDPLAIEAEASGQPKSLRRQLAMPAEIKIVCDRHSGAESAQVVPEEVMVSVKQVVARYLPGMSGARVAYAQERPHCEGKGHVCPTSQLAEFYANSGEKVASMDGCAGKSFGEAMVSRRLITLSKQVESLQGVQHPSYARLTLDAGGKVVKLVVSR